MTAQTRNVQKGRFEDGDKPDGSQYADLIDSYLSLADTTAQTLTSDLVVPVLTATTEVSSPQVNTVEVSASVGSFTKINVTEVSASVIRCDEVSASSAAFGVVKVGGAPVVLAQQTTITASNTAFATALTFEGNPDILGVKFFVQSAFGTAASDVELRIGSSGNETHLGTISMDTNIATGMHDLTNTAFTSAGTSWTTWAGPVFAYVTAVSGAIASGASGVLTVIYLQR